MKRWKWALCGLSLALLAGLIGRWTGSMASQSFAQESEQTAKKTEDQATPEKDLGWMGLMVEEKPKGQVQVANVFPGGPGAFAGLRQGDVVLQVAGVKVTSEAELAKQIEQLKPGQEAVIVVKRNKQEQSLKVVVGSLRDFHARYAREMWQRDRAIPTSPRITASAMKISRSNWSADCSSKTSGWRPR